MFLLFFISFCFGQTTSDNELRNWEKYEDSLRNKILKSKKSNVLKRSFLQEMYIRNVARPFKDSVFISIPFNLHGNDCIAQDCYSTDVSFSFKLGDTLKFPEKLYFREHEHGCVDKETRIADFFQLKELNTDLVIYCSDKSNRTIVLFRTKKESGAYAFYFTKVGPERINGKNVYKIMDKYNENDKNSIYPFTSWVLSTNEYENFAN